LVLALGTSIANVVLVFLHQTPVAVPKSYILEPVALGGLISVTYFNHTRSRTSSSLLLVFWPLYLVALVAWIRTLVETRLPELDNVIILKSVTAILGLLSLPLECFGPEPDAHTDEDRDKAQEESPIVTANLYSIWVRF
jgi:ATP-binding cassette, subfamily C (CFTR/MRP), member 1